MIALKLTLPIINSNQNLNISFLIVFYCFGILIQFEANIHPEKEQFKSFWALLNSLQNTLFFLILYQQLSYFSSFQRLNIQVSHLWNKLIGPFCFALNISVILLNGNCLFTVNVFHFFISISNRHRKFLHIENSSVFTLFYLRIYWKWFIPIFLYSDSLTCFC